MNSPNPKRAAVSPSATANTPAGPKKTRDYLPKKRTRLSVEERKSQIIDAASTEIAEHGFWGFTMRQVAVACGLIEPAVIYHFTSKSELLVEVLVQRDEGDLRDLADHLEITYEALWEDPAPFGLVELCDNLVRRNVAQPEIVQLYTVMQGESLSQKHPAYTYYQDREAWATAMFARAAAHDQLAEPVREGRTVFAQMDGLQLRWLRSPETIDLVAEWELFMKEHYPTLF